jgi:hypothetical protein
VSAACTSANTDASEGARSLVAVGGFVAGLRKNFAEIAGESGCGVEKKAKLYW